jgi:hypothetical protein
MTRASNPRESQVETKRCPVCGREVTCRVIYTASGERRLVHFECSIEGKCGIPSWDPCPLYVDYLEQGPH